MLGEILYYVFCMIALCGCLLLPVIAIGWVIVTCFSIDPVLGVIVAVMFALMIFGGSDCDASDY